MKSISFCLEIPKRPSTTDELFAQSAEGQSRPSNTNVANYNTRDVRLRKQQTEDYTVFLTQSEFFFTHRNLPKYKR